MGKEKSWTVEKADGSVVVGVDGPSRSRTALGWAAMEAADRHVELVILHAMGVPYVSEPFHGPVRASSIPEATGESDGLLTTYAHLADLIRPGLAVRTETSETKPSEALIAASQRAMLVVVGSPRPGELRSPLREAVSLSVCAYATCPVVVVPSEVSLERGGHLVVGVDGSPESDIALRFALEEAALRGSRLTALYVLPSSEEAGVVTLDPAGTQVLLRHAERQVHRMLDEARTEDTERVTVRVLALTKRSHPADALLDAARAADMIVVGSRGMGGFRGLLLGSVSQRLLRRSHIPVVVAHGSSM